MTPSTRAAHRPRPQPPLDELRLLTKVARLYHEKGIRQPQIAAELGMSQPRVSRLLKQAAELGIVRTVVTAPSGVHGDLEDAVQEMFGLRDVIVVDNTDEGDVISALGSAAAIYLDMTITADHVVGISSWSETLLAVVNRMPRKNVASVEQVVQLLGGMGDPNAQVQANRLIGRFAEVTGAVPVLLPAPGLVGDASVRTAMMGDPGIREVADLWDAITDAVVGIGGIDPSPLLQRSGNALTEQEQGELRERGAVGDVCFRYFDAEGRPISSGFDRRVMGITPEQLFRAPRRIGVAGGIRKLAAVRGALVGGWVNVLITDLDLARGLADAT